MKKLNFILSALFIGLMVFANAQGSNTKTTAPKTGDKPVAQTTHYPKQTKEPRKVQMSGKMPVVKKDGKGK